MKGETRDASDGATEPWRRCDVPVTVARGAQDKSLWCFGPFKPVRRVSLSKTQIRGNPQSPDEEIH